jgi:SAM-dependent methyltransferase
MQWFEDESFWRDFYPYMFSDERFAGAAEDVAKIVALTGISSGHVLDLCCGPGRHSIEFARRGFHVTGVDLTPYLLARARDRAEAENIEVEWVREDMRRFHRPGQFDLAVNLFTSFGYFESDHEETHVLGNLFESLRPGGRLVMEMLGKEILARVYQPAHWTDLPGGVSMIARPAIIDDWTRVENRWTLLQNGTTREMRLTHFVYSGRELKDRLLKAGFSTVKIYGGLDGSPYGYTAQRLVAVATKAQAF